MSSAGRAASSSGCVARPRAREIGLIGFAAQIQCSSLTGSCVMETAEHREPCESRGSRTDLGAPGGEIPPGDSTFATEPCSASAEQCPLCSKSDHSRQESELTLCAIDRDRGEPRGSSPPTPPCVRVRTRRFAGLSVGYLSRQRRRLY